MKMYSLFSPPCEILETSGSASLKPGLFPAYVGVLLSLCIGGVACFSISDIFENLSIVVEIDQLTGRICKSIKFQALGIEFLLYISLVNHYLTKMYMWGSTRRLFWLYTDRTKNHRKILESYTM